MWKYSLTCKVLRLKLYWSSSICQSKCCCVSKKLLSVFFSLMFLLRSCICSFSCCRCWSLSSFKRLYILLACFIYSNASWSMRPSHVCETRIQKTRSVTIRVQLIKEAFYSLYSAEKGGEFSLHVKEKTSSFTLSQMFNSNTASPGQVPKSNW